MSKSQKTGRTHRIVAIACLVAINIILSRWLSISMWNSKIGFAFIPVALAGILLGPLAAGLTGAIGDFLGAILFPIGPYFPGFTLTAFIIGIVYGSFIKKSQKTRNIVCAVLINQILLSFLLNTLWISILYGSPYLSLIKVRSIQTIILIVIEIVVIKVFVKYIPQLKKAAL